MTPKQVKTARTLAVVMGDLVHSEHAADIAQLHKAFNEAVVQHNRRYAKNIEKKIKSYKKNKNITNRKKRMIQ